jgi:hypothetical protein
MNKDVEAMIVLRLETYESILKMALQDMYVKGFQDGNIHAIHNMDEFEEVKDDL